MVFRWVEYVKFVFSVVAMIRKVFVKIIVQIQKLYLKYAANFIHTIHTVAIAIKYISVTIYFQEVNNRELDEEKNSCKLQGVLENNIAI